MSRLEDAKLLALDIETTGLNPKTDKILSLGWVPVNGRRILLSGARHYLVSGAPVGQSAVIHHLTDDAVAAGIPLSQALEHVCSALQGRILLAHFAQIELRFLEAALGKKLNLDIVDTFALEWRHMEKMGTYPRGEDLRLSRVRERYGLPSYPNHDALTDALACAELYLVLTGEPGRYTQIRHIKLARGLWGHRWRR